jgi:hypothetical protein
MYNGTWQELGLGQTFTDLRNAIDCEDTETIMECLDYLQVQTRKVSDQLDTTWNDRAAIVSSVELAAR